MATVYGVNQTKINAGGAGDYIIDRGEYAGTLKAMYDTYEASALAAGDKIYIATPPSGSKIAGIIFSCDDLGTGMTVDIGDVANDDRYASAIDVATAAVSGNTTILVDGLMYQIGTATNDDQMTILINTTAATGTIKIVVLYV